jgi:predicted O-methyltransferase YrrM
MSNDKMTAEEIAHKAVNEWFAYQNPFELEMALKSLEKIAPKVILEIGTAHGASLAAWSAMTSPEMTIALDPEDIPRTPEQQASYDFLAKIYNFKRIPLYTRNPKAHEMLEQYLDGRKVDFMFIDGAHGFDDVKHDYYSYRKYMAPNGVVGFHDVFFSEGLVDAGSQVNWLWDRLKLLYAYDEFQYHSSMGIGFIYLGMPATKTSHEL